MSHVFISSTRDNYNLAQRLYNDLTENGVGYWLDMKLGSRWEVVIEEAIDQGSSF